MKCNCGCGEEVNKRSKLGYKQGHWNKAHKTSSIFKEGNTPWNAGIKYTEEQIEKYRKRWRNPKYKKKQVEKFIKASGRKPNKQELKLDKLLQEYFPNQLKYIGDGRDGTVIKSRIPDWIHIGGKKIIVELNGCFWHNCSLCYPLLKEKYPAREKQDEKKKKDFEENGFKIITVWQHELKSNNIEQMLLGLHKALEVPTDNFVYKPKERVAWNKGLKGRIAWNKGKHLSDKHKKSLSDAHLGKICSVETRQKMSDVRKGKPCHNEESKLKLSNSKLGIKNPMFGKKPWNYGKTYTLNLH